MKPSQSQIWSVLRAGDSDDRIFYSMCSTFLGRMGLSGDIYDLSDHQWELVDSGIEFYKEVAHIIKDGKTTYIGTDARRYNTPEGSQLVIREFGNEKLLVFHRFSGSCSLDEYLKLHAVELGEYKVTGRYGKADGDFSAEALCIQCE